MFCFNIPRCNLTEAADIVFPSSMLVPCWFTVFVLWLGHSTPKCQAWFWMFFCFEVVNQRENYKWTTFYCEMLSSRMGCTRLLTLCSRFAHALLTFCSRFAHALLTLCSRFAHALLTLRSRCAQALLRLCSRSPRFLLSPLGSFWVLTRFLLGPYEDLLTVCSRFARGLLTVCSRLLAVLTLCWCFGGWCVYLGEETHKQTMPLFCCSEPCVPKAHSFQAADSLRLIFKFEKSAHMPLTTLRWSGVATPLPEIYMCNVPFEPEGLRKYIRYYDIMTCSFVAQRAQKVHL